MNTDPPDIESIPLKDLELSRTHCLALIDRFTGDMAARRMLIRVNGEIARRKRVTEEPAIVLTPERLGLREGFRGL